MPSLALNNREIGKGVSGGRRAKGTAEYSGVAAHWHTQKQAETVDKLRSRNGHDLGFGASQVAVRDSD